MERLGQALDDLETLNTNLEVLAILLERLNEHLEALVAQYAPAGEAVKDLRDMVAQLLGRRVIE